MITIQKLFHVCMCTLTKCNRNLKGQYAILVFILQHKLNFSKLCFQRIQTTLLLHFHCTSGSRGWPSKLSSTYHSSSHSQLLDGSLKFSCGRDTRPSALLQWGRSVGRSFCVNPLKGFHLLKRN